MTDLHDDDRWLKDQVGRPPEALVRRTVARAVERAATERRAYSWRIPMFVAPLLAAGMLAFMAMPRPRPVVAPVLEVVVAEAEGDEEAVLEELEALDDDEDVAGLFDAPSMMDVDLDELSDDEVEGLRERLKDWPRS